MATMASTFFFMAAGDWLQYFLVPFRCSMFSWKEQLSQTAPCNRCGLATFCSDSVRIYGKNSRLPAFCCGLEGCLPLGTRPACRTCSRASSCC